MKSWVKDNNIEIYLIHNKGKSVVAERFIRTIKTKIYKYMTSVSKNVYVEKLDDTVNKYNNTYHRTIKMKPTMLLMILMAKKFKEIKMSLELKKS